MSLEDYSVGKLIGKGTSGDVFNVFHKSSLTHFAMKRIYGKSYVSKTTATGNL